jgi:hypothetical protein
MKLFKLKRITKNLFNHSGTIEQIKQKNGTVTVSVNLTDVDEAFLNPIPNYFNL